jgi:hypothetical protein
LKFGVRGLAAVLVEEEPLVQTGLAVEVVEVVRTAINYLKPQI